MEAHRLSASEALAEVRGGKLTVEQWVKSLSSRISSRDPVVKAWQYLDVEAVLEQARKLDQIPVEKRGPLHGVPVAVKDIIHTKGKTSAEGQNANEANKNTGMPTCHNSPIYKVHCPELDAGCIQILKTAGALMLGE